MARAKQSQKKTGDPVPRPRSSVVQIQWTLAGILILAAALRFYGLDWGMASLRDFRLDGRALSFVESSFHPDSNLMEEATASLNASIYPAIEQNGETFLFSSYGPVFMYLHWGTARAAGWVLGFTAFGTESVRDANATRLAGRAVSACTAVVCVWLVYALGRCAFGVYVGLLGAFLLAVTPMAIQAAHMATVDGLLSVYAAWVCLLALYILRGGHPRHYAWAGVAVGAAVATKLNGAFLFFPVGLAHLLLVVQSSKGRGILHTLRTVVADRRIWSAAAIVVATYALLTPSAVFRFQDYFFAQFAGSIFHDFGVNLISSDRVQRGSVYLIEAPSYLYHLTHVFPGGLGWPLEAASILGCLYTLYRRKPEGLILAGTALAYFLIFGRFFDKPIRYFVIMGPWFAVLSAHVCLAGVQHARRNIRTLALGTTAIVCGYTAVYATAFAAIYRMPDSRVEAARWIQDHVPEGAAILMERGHNNLSHLTSQTRYRQVMMDIEQEIRHADNNDLVANGDYLACLEREYLAGVDYILLSDDRMPLARRFPAAESYYRALFDGTLGFKPAQTFRMRPGLLGLVLDDSRTDLNGRRYDHPAAFILRASGNPTLYSERPHLMVYHLRTRADCLEVFKKAMRLKDFLLFKRCLPRRLKASYPDQILLSLYYKFLREPELVQRLNHPGVFVQEDGEWRVDIELK